MKDVVYYCYCPVCNKSDTHFVNKANSLAEAKDKLIVHEKLSHKGKEVGIFGKSWVGYPTV